MKCKAIVSECAQGAVGASELAVYVWEACHM